MAVRAPEKALEKPEVHIGLEEKQRQKISQDLSKLLAESYTLYLKTQKFHWNVIGPHFQPLHEVFEGQYSELAEAIDTIAERLRALGSFAPGSFAEFSRLSSLTEEEGFPSAEAMIRRLLANHEAVAETCNTVFSSAEAANDQATMDLMADRLRTHQKTAWMLHSLLS